MSKYDSILKEKPKVVIQEEKPPKFPKFWVSFFLIIVTLVVSYIIYYDQVLNSKNIVLNDCVSILTKYSSLIKNVPLEEFKGEYNLVGNVVYGDDKFDFNLVKNANNIGFNITNNDKYINYYLVDNKVYVKVPSIVEYVSLKSTFSFNTLIQLNDKISMISEDKFVRTIYIADKKPIIEINFVLTTNDLNELFGLGLTDEYEVIVTLKNSAIMNNIEEVKVVINNKTKQDRRVVTINDQEILYKVGSDSYKIILEVDNQDFKIKVSKNDVLYSVLSGANNSDNYEYIYQVIDKVYNFKVLASKNIDGYSYEIFKKKDELEETMTINLKVEEGYIIETDAVNTIESTNGLIAGQYNADINHFKDKWLKFIN